MMKVAADHGDTLHGQHKAYETEFLVKEISKLKKKAIANDLEDVLPRWRGEARRMILMLPSTERLPLMSMFELGKVKDRLEAISDYMCRYNSKRMSEILGA